MAPKKYRLLFFILPLLLLAGCKPEPKADDLFISLPASQTGLTFSNQLRPRADLNMFRYMYFYNGAGIGAGDFNNDGRIDLFFSSNQEADRLFLNKGQLHFEDVTDRAGIPQDGEWSTGVSVVDINNDGLLDIYICRVGHFESLQGKNQFLICQGIDSAGIPHYRDEAAAYGLDFSGFSTQAAFFDYDLDGDLDMYLLNHSVHQNGTYAERAKFLGTYNEFSGDRLYRNDEGHFTDVTRQCGINSSAVGYGLGIAIADINLDGYPDIYVGNDFHENDYLYINQGDGRFTDQLQQRMMHSSQFTMGVDIGDINNDALPDVVSLDMLSNDPYILKRSLGDDSYDVFSLKRRFGYGCQYSRNNLQLNRGNGLFSETGLYSGIAATDWSWASLLMDFDNDGWKDLFISNGIPKRLNDIDYVNFVSSEALQEKINTNTVADQDMALINKFPEIKIPNKFFRNTGNCRFQDIAPGIANNTPTFSNGSIYADLDNDGDLDIVVSNIDEPAILYENTSNDHKTRPALELRLKGPPGNRNAIGARAIVYTRDSIRTYEKYPVKGFQSSMEVPLHIGLAGLRPDSVVIVWPDNTCERMNIGDSGIFQNLAYREHLRKFSFASLSRPRQEYAGDKAENITAGSGLDYRHVENPFEEFDREPLIPFMVSREGPALAVADINGDGLQDVYLGSSKRSVSAVYVQDKSGRMRRLSEPALEADSMYEETDAVWTDINADGIPDLVTANGGNEYYGKDAHLQPTAYLNDGKGTLQLLPGAFDNIYVTASSVAPMDINGDGYIDLFIGGRAVPWAYGELPRSYLLLNDGTGKFKDVTDAYAPDLAFAGFVKQAVWADMDQDGDSDLVLALEWSGITIYRNDKGKFHKQEISNDKGWWNFVLPCDVDGDGDLDLVAGNLGLNSRLRASPDEPVTMYYNDFDGNGRSEQVLTYYLGGREIPFASKDDIQRQIPVMKKKYLYAESFARASLGELFGNDKLQQAKRYTANYFANAVFINNGNLSFSVQALPWQVQLTSYRDARVVDVNHDQLPDILLLGNFYDSNVEMGRYDADFGSVLVNQGKGRFNCEPLNGLAIPGEVRHIRSIRLGEQEAFILARNNDSAMLIRFSADRDMDSLNLNK